MPPSAQVTYRGLSIIGADIGGNVDLKWAKIPFPIVALRCFFSGAIDLSNSHIAFLDLEGSSVSHLEANPTHFEGGVLLRDGFLAWGGVNLVGARIDGSLDCGGGLFIGKGQAPALNTNSIEIKGHVFLRSGFKAEGGVDLTSAIIGRHLDCDNGQFVSKGEMPALNANGAKIEGGVFLGGGFRAEGEVNLVAATIGRHLVCDSGGKFVSKSEVPALNAAGARAEWISQPQQSVDT